MSATYDELKAEILGLHERLAGLRNAYEMANVERDALRSTVAALTDRCASLEADLARATTAPEAELTPCDGCGTKLRDEDLWRPLGTRKEGVLPRGWYCRGCLGLRADGTDKEPVLPPLPAPLPGHGDVIADLLAEWTRWGEPLINASKMDLVLAQAKQLLRDLCEKTGPAPQTVLAARRAKGIATYGQPLRYGDGRGLQDAVEEVADLVCYLRREMGEGEGEVTP